MNRAVQSRRTARVALAVAAVLAVAVATSPPPASATPPTDDPATAAGYGAAWLAGNVTADGYIPGPTDAPDLGATVESAIALGLAGVDAETFDTMVDWIQAHAGEIIAPYGTDSPGQIGYLLLLADLAGTPPVDFGGIDLPARLGATFDQHEPGLYGADDPTYDGVYRQSIAVLGLRAHGLAVPAAALAWLADQQCDAPVAAAGGWQAYRPDTAAACDTPDPVMYTGPDTNSTAMALTADVAATAGADRAAALAFLAAAESDAAGWAYVPGGDDDPNSTALVLMALAAAGEDPSGSTWLRAGRTPETALLSWQIGCDAAVVSDRGAFASPFSDGLPDIFATRQSVWGASGRTFPAGPATFGPTPDPCAPVVPTTAPSTVPSSIPAAPAATVSSAAVVTPAFAG